MKSARFSFRPSLLRVLLYVWSSAFLAVVAVTATAAAPVTLEEGKDCEVMASPLLVAGKNIQVVEFFSYGCPYCARIEPHIEAWLKQKPVDVNFIRFAVSRGERWQSYARAYYTLQAMGEETRLTPLLFKTIHEEKQNLDNEDAFLDWAAKNGLDRSKAKIVYTSEDITAKTTQAIEQAKEYRVRKIPTLFIDGRFHLIPEGVTDYEKIPGMLDALIDKARAARQEK